MPGATVRSFVEDDIPELLELMKGLARFEGYIDNFVVTADDLAQYGLGPNPRFEAFVAEAPGVSGLVGMAVVYQIPWTYDMRPTLVMKELFVLESGRGQGVGRSLLTRVAQRALELDCPRVLWTVLDTNDDARRFYQGAGARKDDVWEPWGLDEAGIAALADES